MPTRYRALVIRFTDTDEHELVNVPVDADTAIDLMLQMQKLDVFDEDTTEPGPEPIEKPKINETPAPKPKAKKKPGRKPRAHYDTDAIVADIKAGMANKDIAQKHNVPIQVVYKVKHQNKAALETAPVDEKTEGESEVPFHFTRALELRQQGYNAEAVRHKLNDYATYDQITDALDWADSQL